MFFFSNVWYKICSLTLCVVFFQRSDVPAFLESRLSVWTTVPSRAGPCRAGPSRAGPSRDVVSG